MAHVHTNGAYIKLGDVEVCDVWMNELRIEYGGTSQSSNAGCGLENELREPGLRDQTIPLQLAVDDAYNDAIRPLLKSQTKLLVIIGPEGNVVGKPVHEQEVIIESANYGGVSPEKTMHFWDISFSASQAPIRNLFDDVF